MLCNVWVRLNEHAELKVLSFIHLDGQTLVGQFRRELRHQPDVGLVCTRGKERLYH